jgi:hypothetical protein
MLLIFSPGTNAKGMIRQFFHPRFIISSDQPVSLFHDGLNHPADVRFACRMMLLYQTFIRFSTDFHGLFDGIFSFHEFGGNHSLEAKEWFPPDPFPRKPQKSLSAKHFYRLSRSGTGRTAQQQRGFSRAA